MIICSDEWTLLFHARTHRDKRGPTFHLTNNVFFFSLDQISSIAASYILIFLKDS